MVCWRVVLFPQRDGMFLMSSNAALGPPKPRRCVHQREPAAGSPDATKRRFGGLGGLVTGDEAGSFALPP